jgi:hypothetical protein
MAAAGEGVVPALRSYDGAGRRLRLCLLHKGKSWIPAFAGMTGWAGVRGRGNLAGRGGETEPALA